MADRTDPRSSTASASGETSRGETSARSARGGGGRGDAAGSAPSSAPKSESKVDRSAPSQGADTSTASSIRNIAASQSKGEAASKTVGEGLKRSGNATLKAAGTVMSSDGTMKDKAQQGAALAAGAAAGAAVGVVTGGTGTGLASNAVTKFVGSKNLKRNIALLLAFLMIPTLIQIGAVISVSAGLGAIVAGQQSKDAQQAAACGAPGSAVDAVTGGMELSGSGVEEQVWNYLSGAGFTPEQTAGIMGNIGRESGFNPFRAQGDTASPKTSAGWGLVQWTAERHVAIRDAVVSDPSLGEKYYVAAPSRDAMPAGMTTDDVNAVTLFQLRYIIRELQTNEKAAGDALKQTTTVEDATRVFESEYERAGVAALAERQANAQQYYARFSGLSAPVDPAAASGEDADLAGGAPSAAESTAPAEGEAAAEPAPGDPCATGITGSVQAGQVAPCPDGNPACVNLQALTQTSVTLICPPGTTDAGIADGYVEGQLIPIRLCNLDGATDASGRPIQMNATIAAQFVGFYNDMAAAGYPVTISSTFRTMAKQISLQGANAAKPGKSNHQFGMAFDIGNFNGSYSRNNCSGHTEERACIPPGGADARWQTMRDIGLKHGMYIHDQEFWHIEFLPSGLHRGRNIPVYNG